MSSPGLFFYYLWVIWNLPEPHSSEESCCLWIEKSHLRWFGHLIKRPPGHFYCEGFRGTSYWKETPEQTQNSLEGSFLSWKCLGDSPGGAGECCWGEGCLGFNKQQKTDESKGVGLEGNNDKWLVSTYIATWRHFSIMAQFNCIY